MGEKGPHGGRETTAVQGGVQARGGPAGVREEPIGDEGGPRARRRPDMLRRWRRKISGDGPGPEREMSLLRRELRDMREERDILKEASAIFSDRRS